jgi:arylsulfatase A-like enzyme
VRRWRPLAAPAALWGAEVAVARLTGVPVTWVDLGLTAAVYLLVSLPLVALAPRWRSLGRPAVVAAVLLALAPLALVVEGLVGPPARDSWAPALTLARLGLLGLAGGLVARRALPGPGLTAGAVALAALAARALDGGAWGPLASGLALGGGLALLAGRGPAGLAAALVGGALIGRWPVSSPQRTAADPAAPAAAGASGPDIVLITVDTLRVDAAEGMAAFERVAAAGARGRLQAASPWTLPSLCSLMTGLPVAKHRAGRREEGGYSGLDAGAQTLAERLRARGYATAAVLAPNPFAGREFGLDRGFDHFDHLREPTADALPRGAWRGHPARPAVASAATALGLWPQPGWGGADVVVDRALAAAAPRERPLFIWVHLLDPHLPYAGAMALDRPWRQRAWLTAATRREILGAEAVDQSLVVEGYAHEVAVTDAALLRLLEGLGPAPPRGRVVALTADHGEALWEHGDFEHGHAFWQEVVSVPLALAAEGAGLPDPAALLAGAGDPGQVALAPWLLAAADGAAAPAVDPLVVSENLMHGGDPFAAWAARRGDLKAIFQAGQALVFDLGVDPGEQADLSGQRPIDALEAAPHGWSAAGEALELDPSAADQLRALGYIGD